MFSTLSLCLTKVSSIGPSKSRWIHLHSSQILSRLLMKFSLFICSKTQDLCQSSVLTDVVRWDLRTASPSDCLKIQFLMYEYNFCSHGLSCQISYMLISTAQNNAWALDFIMSPSLYYFSWFPSCQANWISCTFREWVGLWLALLCGFHGYGQTMAG